jgi:hypothetical protein
MTDLPRTIRLAALGLLLAAPAFAQHDPTVRIDERWRPFLGCWSSQSGGLPGPAVCVVGTADPHTVELLSLAGDSITTRLTVNASGEKFLLAKDGCTGWEQGVWSADERRLFLHSEFSCGGGALQKMSSMYAVASASRFSRIESVTTRAATGVRVITFRAAASDASLPLAIRNRIPDPSDLRSYAARLEAGTPLSTANVVEAAKRMNAPIVEAWLADRGQSFALAGTDLRALRNAGVSSDVIDMMVAVSNPRVFSLAQSGRPEPRAGDATRALPGNRMPAYYDPTLRGVYTGFDPCNSAFSYAGYPQSSWYGSNGGCLYNSFLNPYASCVSSFTCANSGWAYGRGPYVIVATPTSTPTTPRRPGQVVNGSGYSQGSDSETGRRATPVNDGGSRTATSVGSSSSGGGGGSAPAPSASGGGEQRTAKPRP